MATPTPHKQDFDRLRHMRLLFVMGSYLKRGGVYEWCSQSGGDGSGGRDGNIRSPGVGAGTLLAALVGAGAAPRPASSVGECLTDMPSDRRHTGAQKVPMVSTSWQRCVESANPPKVHTIRPTIDVWTPGCLVDPVQRPCHPGSLDALLPFWTKANGTSAAALPTVGPSWRMRRGSTYTSQWF